MDLSRLPGVAALVAALALTTATVGAQAAVSVVHEPLQIAAFNVQRFGVTKAGREDIMAVLTDVLRRYDIVLVQEIVDISETAIHLLLDRVRLASGQNYSLALSPRIGDSSFEQYGFIYRSDRVSVLQQLVYPDDGNVFTREPYIVTFGVTGVRYLSQFTVAGIHTRPTRADVEIDAMSDVLDYIKRDLSARDVILMGDFNAGCSYVTNAEWEVNRLKNRTDVRWLIEDHIDTTVSSTNCAYDRIVIHGDNLARALVAGSAAPFRYDAAWGLTFELTEDVSDHYPVHLTLMPETVGSVETYLRPREVFLVTDRRGVAGTAVRALTTAADTAEYTVTPLYNATGGLLAVNAAYRSYKLSGDGILQTLETFRAAFPEVVSELELALLRYKVSAGALDDPSVYEQAPRPRWYARVSCSADDTAQCDITVEKRTLVA